MKRLVSFFALCVTLVAPAFAAEEITMDYNYEGNVRTDFSKLSRGPLKVGDFSDDRGGNPNLISDGAGGFVADKPLADIVRDALIQGLEKGNAVLVEADENMSLVGTIIASQAEIVDNNGVESIQLTIRTRVQLQGSGRTVWETVLFGRGSAPVADGIESAVYGALDRTIRGLVQDDYFLIEIL